MENVLTLPPRTNLDDSHFKLLNWLPVDKRVTMLKLSHVHNVIHGTAPNYMSNYFTAVNSSHNIQTRSSRASLVPRFSSLLGKSSFKYTGAVEWNSLPLGVQTVVKKVNFKKTIKRVLLDRHVGF